MWCLVIGFGGGLGSAGLTLGSMIFKVFPNINDSVIKRPEMQPLKLPALTSIAADRKTSFKVPVSAWKTPRCRAAEKLTWK